HDDETQYYDSVIVGISAVNDVDVIKLDDQVREAIGKLLSQEEFQNYDARVSASFAPSINEQISELQKSLLEGLLAVLIVGSIVITIRASFITVISMVTVVAVTLGFLHIIGYTLNVITLFSLILALALMVDDTIIMVEAIDAARHSTKDRRKAVSEAASKVSRAMVAATMTAALSFAPLLFVSGMLGTFIRAIPITVMSSLFISLIVALVFIPMFAKYILLNKKQMGKKVDGNSVAGLEDRIAQLITRPMIWARHSTRKLLVV
ncbi:efflux RND transporter permease subunit, partial [Candidatus Saccharibacteria bacterium]|nr:efflux RND transporter permease subunit [Candidatus Saccharibacteria bacterium]